MASWCILWSFGIHIFPGLVCFYQEKSGNPDSNHFFMLGERVPATKRSLRKERKGRCGGSLNFSYLVKNSGWPEGEKRERKKEYFFKNIFSGF
jgi:hypothetical protein